MFLLSFSFQGFKALFAVIFLFDIMKYVGKNVQAFIFRFVKPLVLCLGDTFDHSKTGRRCPFNRVILTSLLPVLLVYQTKSMAGLSCADTFQFFRGITCLGHGPTLSSICWSPSCSGHKMFLGLAFLCQPGHSCRRREQCQLPPPLQLPREPRGPGTD